MPSKRKITNEWEEEISDVSFEESIDSDQYDEELVRHLIDFEAKMTCKKPKRDDSRKTTKTPAHGTACSSMDTDESAEADEHKTWTTLLSVTRSPSSTLSCSSMSSSSLPSLLLDDDVRDDAQKKKTRSRHRSASSSPSQYRYIGYEKLTKKHPCSASAPNMAGDVDKSADQCALAKSKSSCNLELGHLATRLSQSTLCESQDSMMKSASQYESFSSEKTPSPTQPAEVSHR